MSSIRIVVPGNPPRKDAWTRNVAGRGRALTTDAKDWISRLGYAWLQQRRSTIEHGQWTMHLHIYVKLKRALRGESFPFRDCDSSVSCVLDAMTREGVVDDDIRIAPILLMRSHDAKEPRTDITLFPPGYDV